MHFKYIGIKPFCSSDSGQYIGHTVQGRQGQRHHNGTKRLPHGRIPRSSRIGYSRVFWFRDCAREFTRLSASNSVIMSFMNACLGERCASSQRTARAVATQCGRKGKKGPADLVGKGCRHFGPSRVRARLAFGRQRCELSA